MVAAYYVVLTSLWQQFDYYHPDPVVCPVTNNDTHEMERLKPYYSMEFEIKDLGDFKYFLGIEITRSKEGIPYHRVSVT